MLSKTLSRVIAPITTRVAIYPHVSSSSRAQSTMSPLLVPKVKASQTRKVRGKHEFVESPFSGEIVTEMNYKSPDEVKDMLDKAEKAQIEWKEQPLEHRIKVVHQFLYAIERHRLAIEKIVTEEMGKPIKQSRGEIETLKSRTKAFIDIAPYALADHIIESAFSSSHALFSSSRSEKVPRNTLHDHTIPETYPHSAMSNDQFIYERRLIREPVGVVAVVFPWNYPMITACSALIPAILAGNAVVLKPSPRTPSSGFWLEKCFQETEAPMNLVQNIFCLEQDFVKVTQHKAVGHIAFTGSVQGGRNLHQEVAKNRFIQMSLELGGKDALYVAEDADFDTAVNLIVEGALYNTGQTCCAIERVLIHRSLYDSIVKAVVQETIKFSHLGNPLSEKTTIGPMALPSAVNNIQILVDDAREKGARILLGGKKAILSEAPNARFYEPTVIADVTPKMRIFHEEVFGPVISMMPVEDDRQAIQLTNDCKFGLTNAIATKCENRAAKFAEQVHSGVVFMNRVDYIDPYLIWSGKNTDSGYGGSMGRSGFESVTTVKGIHFRKPVGKTSEN